ncbi:hypothetical protein [Alkalibacillus aidingensis]|uniref:hypothetical protein n=1 Tax=Alkalibacillus aidingensis TaxID=2747607 RepID=UPI0016613A26|nr:hypothetical protein [Alkalibacillus aidingensis]
MIVTIPIAIGLGFYMYCVYKNNPMFENPSTITEHFARPIFIGMLTTLLVLGFGVLFANLIIMIPIKRIKLFKMEMEFNSYTTKGKEVANQFLYSSTMLHNHVENVRYLMANNFTDLVEVLQFLTSSYKDYVLQYGDGLALTIDVVVASELRGREEKKIYKSIKQQHVIKSNTAYTNRLIRGENVLLGIVSASTTDEAVMIVRREYNHPFDIYDQETFESILGYTMILHDAIVMLQLLKDNNILDSGSEG